MAFAAADLGPYDRVLIKETIHHVDDPAALYAALFQKLTPGGICLTCTRPHTPQYPFFPAAMKVWEQNQPDVAFYSKHMEAAGFAVTALTGSFPASLKAADWHGMVTCWPFHCNTPPFKVQPTS